MIDFPLPIVGTKVLIRGMREQDIEPLYNLDTDEDVKRYLGGALTRPKHECIEGMRQLTVFPLIVTCEATDNFVGRAALSPEDTEKQCFEIQVVLAKKYWGQHLGREVTELLMGVAFDHIKASSVIVIFDPNHKAARTVADELGFSHVETRDNGRL